MLTIGLFADVPIEDVPARYCRWFLDLYPGLLTEEDSRTLQARVVGLERVGRVPGLTVEEQVVRLQHDRVAAGLAADHPAREALAAYRDRLIKQFSHRNRRTEGATNAGSQPPTGGEGDPVQG